MKHRTGQQQSGAASIMFAMFLVIVISLVAIGFASLVRNDQRQTLDKTLSNQAQYAAESAINKIQTDLRDTTSGIPAENTACNTNTSYWDSLPGLDISCVTWDKSPGSLLLDAVGTSPSSLPVKPSGSVSELRITWSPQDTSEADVYSADSTKLELADSKIPMLRIALADESLNNLGVIYLKPTSGPISSASAGSSGSIGLASCTGTPVTCEATISNLPGGDWDMSVPNFGYISIAALGGKATSVRVENNGPAVTFADAQAEIDATARAQDVIKRLQARAPLGVQAWRPGFAAAADTLCKNFRVDGTNTAAGPADSVACPN